MTLYFKKSYTLFLVKNSKGDIIHQSARIGSCFKLNFLKENEYEIGPCFTKQEYRGQNIYPSVLNIILMEHLGSPHYMIIEENNKSSQNGVKKSGFQKICKIYRGRFGVWEVY